MKFIIAIFFTTFSISSWAWPTLQLSFSGNIVKHAGRYESFNIDISRIRGWDKCTFWPIKEKELDQASVTCFAKSGVALGLNCYSETAMLFSTTDDPKIWLHLALKCKPSVWINSWRSRRFEIALTQFLAGVTSSGNQEWRCHGIFSVHRWLFEHMDLTLWSGLTAWGSLAGSCAWLPN